jgi:hypothetical protein
VDAKTPADYHPINMLTVHGSQFLQPDAYIAREMSSASAHDRDHHHSHQEESNLDSGLNEPLGLDMNCRDVIIRSPFTFASSLAVFDEC